MYCLIFIIYWTLSDCIVWMLLSLTWFPLICFHIFLCEFFRPAVSCRRVWPLSNYYVKPWLWQRHLILPPGEVSWLVHWQQVAPGVRPSCMHGTDVWSARATAPALHHVKHAPFTLGDNHMTCTLRSGWQPRDIHLRLSSHCVNELKTEWYL